MMFNHVFEPIATRYKPIL